MRRTFERVADWFGRSRLFRLVLYFALVFLASGTIVALVEKGKNAEFQNILDGWWWVVITFSTTGYGDKVPITTAARLITVVTVLFGIVAMSVVSGTLASVFVEQNTKARRGLMQLSRLSNHFIICGWKEQMQEILLDILELTAGLSASQIVVVSNIDEERIEALRHNSRLKTLRFVRGDYFSDSALERANVKKARKVLVLADTFESRAASEVDSKTVMTVLTAKSIARDVFVCAELIDRKYEGYLKQAMCDEIIFTSDFNRQIVANASAVSGIAHIMRELLAGNDHAARLATLDIPNELIGKPYGELRGLYGAETGRVLIGLLENTGSPNSVKLEALREAQKTSDVSRLVNNLQSVKGLEVNRPVLVPDDGYLVLRHSRAIVLER